MKTFSVKIPAWVSALLCPLLALLGILEYNDRASERVLALLAVFGVVALLALCDLGRLRNLPSLLLLGYVAFSMLTAFWAMSGKFFLRHYSAIFVAAFFFLLVVLLPRRESAADAAGLARRVMGVLAGVATLYAFVGVEGAATGVLSRRLFSEETAALVRVSGRLSGAFQNTNIDASFFALGVLFTLALVCGAESRAARALWAAALGMNAYAFLLAFSGGAMVCFAFAVMLYIAAAGKGRAAVVVRMVEGALPAAVCVALSLRCFNAEGKGRLALLLFLAGAAVTALAECLFAEKLRAALEPRSKLLAWILPGLVALAALYFLVGLQLGGAYTFGGTITRSRSLPPGEHTLLLDADGEVAVHIRSRNQAQILTGGSESLDEGSAGDAARDGLTFAVPEGSLICQFTFDGAEGATLRSATVDGRPLTLAYKIIPNRLVERLQRGLTADDSYLSRVMLWRYGMQLFRLSPIVGSGVGAFETGIDSVEEYYSLVTRYVHNHYIQVLLESGVIGFALFAGALAAMAVALWKKRKPEGAREPGWAYPALCAELAMSSLQMLWDVSMSIMAFICCVYAVYALIVGLYAEPVGARRAEERQPDALSRIVYMALPLFFAASICGNLYAARLSKKTFASYEEFYETFERAVKLDLYDKNDLMLTYLMQFVEDDTSSPRIAQANEYAARLSKTQSNTLPYYLTYYYLKTAQYEKAVDEAILGAKYSISNEDNWYYTTDLLKQVFMDSGALSPLLRDDGALLEKLMEYYAILKNYNETAIQRVRIDPDHQLFYDTLLTLDACGGDADAMYAILAPEEPTS